MAHISVCVATTRPSTVGAMVRSILRQTWTDWELVVVGQGDADALRRAVDLGSGKDPRVRYVHSDRRGLSAARNRALSESSGDIFAMTDDDCEARSDWLTVLAARFNADKALGLVGGTLVAPPPEKRFVPSSCLSNEPGDVVYDPTVTPPPAPAGFGCVGGNMAVTRAAAERVGRFDELLGAGARFPSGEDLDYVHRLELAGVKMACTPRSVVFHTHGRRYGPGRMVSYWHGQGTGHGAISAKLTLRGDPRGAEAVRIGVAQEVTQWLPGGPSGNRLGSPKQALRRLASDSVRLPTASVAYRSVLRHYVVDDDGVLRRRTRTLASQRASP